MFLLHAIESAWMHVYNFLLEHMEIIVFSILARRALFRLFYYNCICGEKIFVQNSYFYEFIACKSTRKFLVW